MVESMSSPSLAATPLSAMDEPSRLALQRRTLQVLFIGQVLGSAGISVAVSVGGRFLGGLLNGSKWAGSSSAMVTLGGAVAGLCLSGLMKARGRRPGLALGYLLSLLGGLVVVLGIERSSVAIFLFGSLFFGVGQGTNLLARYAAADLTTPAERATAMSTLMFGSTFGAVLSLVLVEPLRALATSVGLVDYSGPYLFAMVLLVGAIANTLLRLHPDPLVVAGGVTPGKAKITIPNLGRAVRVVAGSRLATLGFVSMVVSQTAMVAVMTMTPLHMKEHGHDGTSSYVIALHVVGMYGFAPFVGRLSDRWGRLRTILLGAGVMVASTLVSAGAGTEPPLLFVGLFLLGLGWSASMISGTALVSDNVPIAEKVGVQGSVDLVMSLAGGLAAFSSGFIKDMLAYHTLSLFGTAMTAVLLLFALATLRASQASPAVAG